jgi:hypothetical protein
MPATVGIAEPPKAADGSAGLNRFDITRSPVTG